MPFEQAVDLEKHFDPLVLVKQFRERKIYPEGWYVFIVQNCMEQVKDGEVSWVINAVNAEDTTETYTQWITLQGSKRKPYYYSNQFDTLKVFAHGLGLTQLKEASELNGKVTIAKLTVEEFATNEVDEATDEVIMRQVNRLAYAPTVEEIDDFTDGDLLRTAAQRKRLKTLHTRAVKAVAKGDIPINEDGNISRVPNMEGYSADEAGILYDDEDA